MAKATDVVAKYAQAVVRGDVVAGQPVVWACERHLADLERDDVYFDAAEADRVLRFCRLCHHVEGTWDSPTFIPEPWQEFSIGSIFGWRRPDGRRRFRIAWIRVARKNGKSFLCSVLGLYMMVADHEPGAQVWNAATKRDQARVIHRAAIAMRDRSPHIRRVVGKVRDRLYVRETNSFFAPLGADSDTEDGLNPHMAILDEIHAHKDGGMWDVLDSGMGSRRQPLLLAITTSGYGGEQSFGAVQDHYFRQIVDPESAVEKDDAFVFIAELDEGDDPLEDPGCWEKANPNLGVSVFTDYLESRVEEARQNPRVRNDVLCKNFNVWVTSQEAWLDLGAWDDCREDIDPELLRGERCFGGLDLSTRKDLTALALFFPRHRVLRLHFWHPEENVLRRVKEDRVPYDLWAKDGHIELTSGNEVDYGAVRRYISGMGDIPADGEYRTGRVTDDAVTDLYRLEELAYDPWRGGQLITNLRDMDGVNMVEVRPIQSHLADAAEKFETMILGRDIRHDGHPVMRWNVANTAIKTYPNGYFLPDKERSRERIDGVMAAIMAISRWQAEERQGRSRWEDEDADLYTVG